MTPASPPSPPAGRAVQGRAGREGVRWDAAIAVALGVALFVGGWLDVSAYLTVRGKSQPAFRLLNTSAGQRIRLNEFFQETSSVVHLGNIGRLEYDDPLHQRLKFRQALGPVSTVEIWTDRTYGRIEFALRNPHPDQMITVACNGQTLEEIHLDEHEEATRQYPLELRPGSNQFTLTFTRYDPPTPGERPIAARLLALDLYLPAADGSF